MSFGIPLLLSDGILVLMFLSFGLGLSRRLSRLVLLGSSLVFFDGLGLVPLRLNRALLVDLHFLAMPATGSSIVFAALTAALLLAVFTLTALLTLRAERRVVLVVLSVVFSMLLFIIMLAVTLAIRAWKRLLVFVLLVVLLIVMMGENLTALVILVLWKVLAVVAALISPVFAFVARSAAAMATVISLLRVAFVAWLGRTFAVAARLCCRGRSVC